MKTEILIIGEGGQGIQTLGDILAEAAHNDGYWPYSKCDYTPAPRGGEVIASVIIAGEAQIYPLVEKADYVFVLSSNKSLEFVKDKITEKTCIVSVDPDSVFLKTTKIKRLFVIKHDDKRIPLNIFMLAIIQEIISMLSDESIAKAVQKILGKKRIGLE
ncbi:MAG: 2-oxoacid:acceptor oxidoreductase family protein [Candidatus Portnoybacteria bacterium]|nr:2-oxoacid:acceptor oxidoreductase family protein [Candidatus Portnoybacteria bacterium]